MSFTAGRPLKIQKTRDDGTIYFEQRMVGDAVPEAADWRDLPRWIRTGYVIPNKGVNIHPGERGKYKPPVPAASVRVEKDATSVVEAPNDLIAVREQLEAMTKKEVIKMARELGVKLDKDETKGAFIDAILATEDAKG